jgi:drug/metabolite transporter (DMT)-like permease
MFQSHLGEFAALLTAVFWTVTALAFESASKKIGSLTVNLIRLCLAFLFLGTYSLFARGTFLPLGGSAHNWIWLSVSGLIGFVLGDLFLFRSYVVMSARISMLIMALAPPIAAVIGWLMMGETMSIQSLAGMLLTIAGIALVILERKRHEPEDFIDKEFQQKRKRRKMKFSYPIKGLLLAFGGAAGQAGGLVLSKYGMADYDTVAATQIRVITGILGFAFIFTILGRWHRLKDAFKNREAMGRLTIGAFFGPFLGVTFSLLSVKHTSTGIASTIMAIVPVLIIPPAIIFFREKVTPREILGAMIAIGGVALFFI